jgi:predicted alpha/beta-hydrolase family hydrolase
VVFTYIIWRTLLFSLEGKGIAALTFDKDYQRKRREAMNQRPSNVQTGLAQSGKGLVMVSKIPLHVLYSVIQ